jgi:cytoskeleton protein RodZ
MSDQQMNEAPLSQEGGAAPQSPAIPLPGAVLAEQRQKKGWTIEQAASLVKLAPRQVHAIETDNYAALPGLAVARGFVRSYAKALGLDADAVIAGMPKDSPVAQRDHIVPQHSLSTPFSEGPLPAMMLSDRNGTSPVTVLIGVVVLAAVVAAAAVHWTGLGNEMPQLAWLKPHAVDATNAADTNVPAEPAPVTDASSDTPVNARVETLNSSSVANNASAVVEPAPVTPTPAPAAPSAIVPATPSASVPATAPSTSAAPAATAPAAAPVAAADTGVPSGLNIVNSRDLLRLTFREDSWVEIRRADKTTVISRLLKAGTTEAFDVADASVLVVGNAAGVDATLRGKPLELKSSTGNNVARLNLN